VLISLYVQTALLFGVYTTELFPTEIRLRANGICNPRTRRHRGVALRRRRADGIYQLPGVVWLMIGLVWFRSWCVGLGRRATQPRLEEVAAAKA